MPGLVPGIHVFGPSKAKRVDGRVKPGHDECTVPYPFNLAIATPSRAS
jgi:hypothetical protein